MLSGRAYFCLLVCLLTSIALVQETAAQYGSFGNMLGFGNYDGGNSLGSFWLFCGSFKCEKRNIPLFFRLRCGNGFEVVSQ
ncbi:hypothetical protein QR680_016361 [Steinernema hermaphroditum]|uniref:Uncharacterized protein n=1 Tax=Steinernema hermaphroditum TaxID=289476 RepID=A0AA39HAZ5_9BILA|nr:hypothetical protein QR680_016361 [Steinernema hermaphroditum]